ncbi:MAG: CoA-transferase [Acidimicrobiia bacterium]|nr:MAG: CoA-transferase [Acidimicrobiia bacterium]
MRRDRTLSLADAVALVEDGSLVYFGGNVLRRKPMAFARALAASARSGLEVMAFTGSLEVELLVAAGVASVVSSTYVGLGRLGFAPVFRRAVEAGVVEDREYSEWTMLLGLRAAAMGLPFLPSRGGSGSQILEHLAIREVEDPYGGDRYLAVPPIRPDVAVIHAWRATASGEVQMAWPPEHLWDVDVVAAQAAKTCVVTVEQIVDRRVVAAQPHLTVLCGVDVDAVVEAPGGAWPTASPPRWEEDHRVILRYGASGDPDCLTEADR